MYFSTNTRNKYLFVYKNPIQQTSINSFLKKAVGSRGHRISGSNIHLPPSSFDTVVC